MPIVRTGSLDLPAAEDFRHGDSHNTVDYRPRFSYIERIKACSSKGTFRVRPRRWSKCGSRGRSRKPSPGGLGHHSRRYYGRRGRCSPWTGIGEGG